MNQQQATELIQQELRQGRNTEEIVQLLSHQLPAPHDLLTKFVEKVAAQMPPTQPTPAFIQDEQPVQIQSPSEETAAEKQPALVDPVAGSVQPASSMPAGEPAPVARPASRPDPLKDPKLTEYVVKRLNRHHRKSDIAMAICERTGVDWKEAQRFVSQVNIEQIKRISKAKNLPVVIFCGLFIFSGLIMIILGGISLVPYLSLFLGDPSSSTGVPDYDIRGTVYLLLGGVGLILGGLVGLYLVIRPQIE